MENKQKNKINNRWLVPIGLYKISGEVFYRGKQPDTISKLGNFFIFFFTRNNFEGYVITLLTGERHCRDWVTAQKHRLNYICFSET